MQRLGGREATQQFIRLFLLPGVGHCRGGTGPDTFDGMSPLVEWVEHGVPPERIIAAQMVAGKVVRTRPLAPYPQVARWTGQGSIDDARNFVCVNPDE
jgi:feruloyl esterase